MNKLLIILLLLLPTSVLAGEPRCKGKCEKPASAEASAEANSKASANADADSDSRASANSKNSYSTENEWFSLATTFPELEGCLGGGQAGASGGGFGLFFGRNKMNAECWLEGLAAAETNLDMRARLKCGDSVFRKAVAYDTKTFLGFGKRKQVTACIEYVTPIWKEKIDNELSEAAKYKATLECSYIGGVLSLNQTCVKE